MFRKLLLSVLLVLGFIPKAGWVFAMTSTNYGIAWDSINSGGLDEGSSTNYILQDTVGEQATGDSSSTNYQVSAGYRVFDASSQLSFDLYTQENSIRIAYTAFSDAGKTVNVSSAASFLVGDMIGVVENDGLSESIAVGKILSIVGLTLTVDAWNGSPVLIGALPSGGDDVVYRLNGSAAQLGTLGSSLGNTSLTATNVSTTAPNGYSVYVSDDGDLRASGSASIQDVADGAVTIGSEEYGWHVFGASATNTASDYAFSTSTALIQSSSTAATNERIALIYKVSISPSTPAGSYAHTVYYTVTANY